MVRFAADFHRKAYRPQRRKISRRRPRSPSVPMNKNAPMNIATSQAWHKATVLPSCIVHNFFRPEHLRLKPNSDCPVIIPVFNYHKEALLMAIDLLLAAALLCAAKGRKRFATTLGACSFGWVPVMKLQFYTIKKIEFKTALGVNDCYSCIFKTGIL
jgi:hypothetical protein